MPRALNVFLSLGGSTCSKLEEGFMEEVIFELGLGGEVG